MDDTTSHTEGKAKVTALRNLIRLVRASESRGDHATTDHPHPRPSVRRGHLELVR